MNSLVIRITKGLHQTLHDSLCTYAAEHSRDIGDRADLGLLVAVFAWNYRILVREFLRENHLETLLYSHVSEALTHDIGKRAVE